MDKTVYKVERPIYTYEKLSKEYNEEVVSFSLMTAIKYKTKLKAPSCLSVLFYFFPFPILMSSFYKAKYLIYDLIAGLTMFIFHIPQGMAYGLLSGVKPINGLYASFFPPLVYFLFGTSRHLSLGTFSIMSLLSSVPVIREANVIMNDTYKDIFNRSDVNHDIYEENKLQISIATTLLAGLIQLAMGFCNLGYIMNYITDSMIGGFTCATSFHVIVSQLAQILGYSIQRYSGLGEFPYKLYLFAIKISKTHLITLGISISCIVILLLFTEIINPRIQKRLKFPFPIQLVILVISIILSYFLSFSEKYNVKIVSYIPKGLPLPMIPDFKIWPRIIFDGILLAVFGFIMNSSLTKVYALKFSYDVNYNQEARAYGLANIVGSFFQCVMSAGALARSSVAVQVGMKSQLATFVSCILMLLALLFIGPILEHVPNCVLSSIIVVSLKSMIMQLQDLPSLYKSSKFDFNIWIVCFLSTIFLNVPYGMVIGFLFSLLTIIIRIQNPGTHVLGQLPHTNIYRDIKTFKNAVEIPGVKIFKFDGPLYFANAEYFQIKLYKKTGINPLKMKHEEKSITNDPSINGKEVESLVLDNDKEHDGKIENSKIFLPNNNQLIKHIIIDCSSMSFIDNVAIRFLDDIFKSYQKFDITVVLVGLNIRMRKMLSLAKFANEWLDKIMFITVHDAVLSIQSKSHLS